MNFTLGHALCDVNPYYGLISAPKVDAINENMRKYRSTFFPIQSTLFYIVKDYCEQMRHMHAILKCE